jgi:hypothetical protein
MSSAVVAALIAASASLVTLCATLITQYLSRRESGVGAAAVKTVARG